MDNVITEHSHDCFGVVYNVLSFMNFACQTSWKHWISVLLENFVSIERSWTLFYLILFKCSFMEICQWETAFVSLIAFSCTSLILCGHMITQSSCDKFKSFLSSLLLYLLSGGCPETSQESLAQPFPSYTAKQVTQAWWVLHWEMLKTEL